MKTIVITGSTRGIGLGLAKAFLDLGCAVVVSGRQPAGVDAAVAGLGAGGRLERVLGVPCDVTNYAQVEALWQAAVERFGRVDLWVNNAGLAQHQSKFWDLTPELMCAVVDTNVLGVMYGARVAIRGMLAQGFGALYNMEGLGSDGRRPVEGLSLYATTKYALRYLNQSLAEETAGTPVLVGALSPGMVATEMLSGQYEGKPQEWERARRVFNILADRVETVTPWLARQILANRKNGARIAWLNPAKIMSRFLLAPFRKRVVFD